ncbi:putative membrane protein [Burkholderia cepacia]|nr:putative membrane protein [Burkholderia cepacia]
MVYKEFVWLIYFNPESCILFSILLWIYLYTFSHRCDIAVAAI